MCTVMLQKNCRLKFSAKNAESNGWPFKSPVFYRVYRPLNFIAWGFMCGVRNLVVCRNNRHFGCRICWSHMWQSTWKTCWGRMTVARQLSIPFILTLVIGSNKPFKGCLSWGMSGWSLAEVICKWDYSTAGVHRFCRTSGGTSKL